MRKLIASLLLLTAVTACGSSEDGEQKRQECLYAAVAAYPSLPVDSLALDSVKQCEGLSSTDRAALRTMMDRFVGAAFDKSTGASEGGQ